MFHLMLGGIFWSFAIGCDMGWDLGGLHVCSHLAPLVEATSPGRMAGASFATASPRLERGGPRLERGGRRGSGATDLVIRLGEKMRSLVARVAGSWAASGSMGLARSQASEGWGMESWGMGRMGGRRRPRAGRWSVLSRVCVRFFDVRGSRSLQGVVDCTRVAFRIQGI